MTSPIQENAVTPITGLGSFMPSSPNIPFFHGDVLSVAGDTRDYLDQNPEIAQELSERMWAYQELVDLSPQTIDKFFAGSLFPLVESGTEITNSHLLAHMGLYRHSYTSLRMGFELGLLSVYWDRNDQSESEIGDWLNSKRNTPSMGAIRKGLGEIPAVAAFQQQVDFDGWIQRTYKTLNAYVHVRGRQYSTMAISGSTIPRFEQSAFELWRRLLGDVIKLVSTAHLLKYPIGLQYTPLDEKFGFNSPVGGFLRPDQSDQIRAILDPDHLDLLQVLSDRDEWAVSVAKDMNDSPDITEEQLEEQLVRQAKSEIEFKGFRAWHEERAGLLKADENPPNREAERFNRRSENLKAWAEAEGMLEEPRRPSAPSG